MKTATTATHQEQTIRMLRSLQIPGHRFGYKHLCVAIPYFSRNDTMSLSKELYPYLAEHFGYSDWHAIETDIHDVILAAWENHDPTVWDTYFPGATRAPSNRVFLSALAERLT